MNENNQKLLEEVQRAKEPIKDFNTYKHLWSEDVAERTLAELNQTLARIEFYLKLAELKEVEHPKEKALRSVFLGGKTGDLVRIKPCAEEYKGKTYTGFLVGDLATGSSICIKDEKIACEWSNYNPAIFVPELGKVIMGYESWWGVIKSEDDLRQITQDDIDNVWYVKFLKAITKPDSN